MYCATWSLVQATLRDRRWSYEQNRAEAVFAIETAIGQLDMAGALGILTVQTESLVQSLKRLFSTVRHLYADITSAVLRAETQAELSAARKRFADQGQTAFTEFAAALEKLAEHLSWPAGTIPEVVVTRCKPPESS